MSKYKVGDIVKVRDDLVEPRRYGGLTYIDTMYGEALEIAEVGLFGKENWYRVCVGQDTSRNSSWLYSEEMFEGLACEPEPEAAPAAEESSSRLDRILGVLFIRVGRMTVCVPTESPIGIAFKNPKDEECAEIGEALAYQRMMRVSLAKEE